MSDPPRAPDDAEAAANLIEVYYARGYSEGLPVMPPSTRSVQAMLDAARLEPHQPLGHVPIRNKTLTAEAVAINAVLAGCLPAYMPVVAAAARALCAPEFGLHPVTSGTGGSALLVLANGPYARAIGLNAGEGALGPGNRANATIGRAVRLIVYNALGTRPGGLDRATLGYPGRYTFCFAEDEAGSPWAPLHAERGFAPETSTVTLFAAGGVMQIHNGEVERPEPMLRGLAESLAFVGSQHFHRGAQPEAMAVLGPVAVHLLRQHGWSKSRVQAFVHEHARRSVAELKRAGRMAGEAAPGDDTDWVHALHGPEGLMVVCAGGVGGPYSALITGGGSHKSTHSVTVAVQVP